jgi:hypothetical protein
MPTIPTIEPTAVTAGDTLQWTRALGDYPANAGWTLSYRLINATNKYDITGTASGADHSITVLPAASVAYVAGNYDWQSYVTNASGERHTIGNGRMAILPNLAGVIAAGFDNRSQARQILEGLQAAWLDAVTNRAFVLEYRIATRLFKFATRQEWILEINYWRRIVAKEDRAANIARGLASGRKVLVRF